MFTRRRGVLRKSDLRETNERLILNIIRQNRDLSRSDIVKITGLSASSVTFIVNRLISEGLVAVARGSVQTQAGRPPVSLRLRPESMYAIGAEVTIRGARVRAADVSAAVLLERQIAWNPNPAVMLVRLRTAIGGIVAKFAKRRLVGIGVGIPGTIVRDTGYVMAAEDLGWFEVDAGRILADGLAVQPVVENDAKLAAFAEHWFNTEGTPSNFVFVAGARGLGTGVFVDGQLLQGASGEGSEFGHTVLYPDGRPCVCGGRGCWEEYASARALERLYTERAAGMPTIGADEIVRRARDGDDTALSALQETAFHVGLGFVNLRQAFDPEQIIVGSYLAEAWDLIEEIVSRVLRDRIAARYLERVQIVRASHTKDSTLVGAIGLALSSYFGANARLPFRKRRVGPAGPLRATVDTPSGQLIHLLK
jgi:predicted NBD/HSP70 family sugar kinase